MVRPMPWTLVLTLAVASTGSAQPLVEIKQDNPVGALAWSGDGKRLASAWEDGTIRVTEIPSGKELFKMGAGAPLSGLVFSADGTLLGAKSRLKDGPLSVWDVKGQKKLRELAYMGYTCNQLAFTPDGETLVASGAGEHMVWNHTKGSGYGSKMGKVPEGSLAAISPSGSMALWSNPQGFVQFFHINPRKFQQMQVGPVTALALSSDNGVMAVAAQDKSIRLWAVQGAELRKFEGLREAAKLLSFSGNGKVLAAASTGDPVIRLWDVASARLRRRLTVNPSGLIALALSPDGLNLAMGNGQSVAVWNVATRELGELGQPKALSAAELKTAWDGLADADHTKAEAAFRQLAVAQHHALDFLKEQVRAVAVPTVDWKRVDQLLVELDDPAYPVRQRASQELAKVGEPIQKSLEKYLAAKPSLEGERRARKLLDRVQSLELTPDRLRCIETIEILEILHTPEAQELLREFARDSLVAQVRLAATEALARLNRLPATKDTPKKPL